MINPVCKSGVLSQVLSKRYYDVLEEVVFENGERKGKKVFVVERVRYYSWLRDFVKVLENGDVWRRDYRRSVSRKKQV